MNDRSLSSIEFRYEIPEFDRLGIRRNSAELEGIPSNSIFMQFRNSPVELDDQMIRKACFNIIACSDSGIPRNSYQFRFYVILESEGIPRRGKELDLTNSEIRRMV